MEKPEIKNSDGPAKPLIGGRLLRVLFGAALLAGLAIFRPASPLVLGLVLFLGISLVAGGILAHPGCEIFVLPSLLARTQLHCF